MTNQIGCVSVQSVKGKMMNTITRDGQHIMPGDCEKMTPQKNALDWFDNELECAKKQRGNAGSPEITISYAEYQLYQTAVEGYRAALQAAQVSVDTIHATPEQIAKLNELMAAPPKELPNLRELLTGDVPAEQIDAAWRNGVTNIVNSPDKDLARDRLVTLCEQMLEYKTGIIVPKGDDCG